MAGWTTGRGIGGAKASMAPASPGAKAPEDDVRWPPWGMGDDAPKAGAR